MRKSLKDQQQAVLLAFFSHELHPLVQAHEQGELSLWFYDETGLGLNPTGLYAWQQPSPALHLPACRGHGFTVAGFLGADTRLQAFIQFVDEWIVQHPPTGKTVLVLDNASFDCRGDVLVKRKVWASQQVYLQYLAAYRPDRVAGAIEPA